MLDRSGKVFGRYWRLAARAVVAACFSVSSVPCASAANQPSYWLRMGYTTIPKCPGITTPQPLKVAMLNSMDWVLVNGVVTCRDAGASYVYEVQFLRVAINPKGRTRISRPRVTFDFIGMAVYRGTNQEQTVEYLAEPAKSIRGVLDKTSSRPIYFGGIQFQIPKEAIAKASHVTMYITAQNILFPFGFL